jgi:hypothetical protein
MSTLGGSIVPTTIVEVRRLAHHPYLKAHSPSTVTPTCQHQRTILVNVTHSTPRVPAPDNGQSYCISLHEYLAPEPLMQCPFMLAGFQKVRNVFLHLKGIHWTNSVATSNHTVCVGGLAAYFLPAICLPNPYTSLVCPYPSLMSNT